VRRFFKQNPVLERARLILVTVADEIAVALLLLIDHEAPLQMRGESAAAKPSQTGLFNDIRDSGGIFERLFKGLTAAHLKPFLEIGAHPVSLM